MQEIKLDEMVTHLYGNYLHYGKASLLFCVETMSI